MPDRRPIVLRDTQQHTAGTTEMDEGVADDGKTEARQIDPSTPAIASPGTSGPQQLGTELGPVLSVQYYTAK